MGGVDPIRNVSGAEPAIDHLRQVDRTSDAPSKRESHDDKYEFHKDEAEAEESQTPPKKDPPPEESHLDLSV